MKIKFGWLPTSIAVALAAGASMALTGPALAQDMAESETGTALEEVTVTARKREEALQDVALSVSAMGQREIDANFATDLRDLTYVSPNLVLDDTNQGPGGVAATYIRGIGVSEVEKNFDPAVGVVVDGVFRGTMTGSIVRAIDLQRVEVLRGPQGTLFGRNTIGGVINLERSKPTMESGGKVRGSYGDYETAVLDGIVNFGNGETWGVKLSASYRDQGEGYFKNVTTGRRDGQSEYKAGGVNLLFAPADGVEIEWTSLIERTDQDSNQLLNVAQPGQVFCDVYAWCSPNTSTPVSGDRYRVGQAFDNYTWPTERFPTNQTPDPGFDHFGLSPFNSTFDADTHQVEVRWDLNENYRIDYIGARWETEEKVITDWDATQDLLFHTDRPAEYEQDTHELRLTYDAGEELTYTVGAYYWDSEYEIRLRSLIAFFTPFDGFLLDLPQTTNQTSESKALFFEGDYRFNEAWTLTVGGRWTDDDKTTDQFNEGNPFTTTASAKESWSEFTPKVALKWDFQDDAMLYALYSRGYRAGGFNGRVDSVETATIPYDPETVDNYELGYKSRHMDGRLQFNATLFYMDYKDKQEEIQQPSETSGTGQVTRVVNASNATISGAELELMYLFESGLTMRANLGLLDAEYDDFLVDVGTPDNPVFADFSSLDFRRAPEVTASVSGEYEVDLEKGSLLLHAGARYMSSHEVDFANKPELSNGSSTVVDASISYFVNNWYLSAFGRNLTDDDSYALGFDVAGLWSYAAVRPPRTYGFEVGYSW
ncbi:MAG: TonB-dependent receptor [Xanthomonadales bacterium]|nr:TonB-dependent receptor [Xanthomonadales bacterium]NIN58676.1 TonB-dependent receptor [Xanthomonadales bacterium]NIN74526.1 TonB-dependent receptor [Xanthomonadales bacterium]NIO14831.1 TonB-dependent receptor [Xanthomonadales bacterium]NIP11069.1 TonB-dependent receptor [Xanthomonadales bacterium]